MKFRYPVKQLGAGRIYKEREKQSSASALSVCPVPNDLPCAGSQRTGPAHEENLIFPEKRGQSKPCSENLVTSHAKTSTI